MCPVINNYLQKKTTFCNTNSTPASEWTLCIFVGKGYDEAAFDKHSKHQTTDICSDRSEILVYNCSDVGARMMAHFHYMADPEMSRRKGNCVQGRRRTPGAFSHTGQHFRRQSRSTK